MSDPIQRGRFRRHALAVFIVCLLFYAFGFWGVEHWRQRRGPWEVTFQVGEEGAAILEVDQARLGVTGLQLHFPEAALPEDFTPVRVRFASPAALAEVPFGRVLFLDTTVLPGTVTFDLFGHEVELLPRVLIVDKVERAWESGRVITVGAREAEGVR